MPSSNSLHSDVQMDDRKPRESNLRRIGDWGTFFVD